MNPQQLRTIMPFARERADTYAVWLTAAMTEYGIDAPQCRAAFVAQIAHESGELRYTREIASGEAYEDRADLGNILPGDGVRFAGRGLIMITGRANYARAAEALGLDLLAQPELLERPAAAARVSAWFWHTHQLNRLAIKDRFGAITKAINGGYNGLDERIAYWLRARKVCGL